MVKLSFLFILFNYALAFASDGKAHLLINNSKNINDLLGVEVSYEQLPGDSIRFSDRSQAGKIQYFFAKEKLRTLYSNTFDELFIDIVQNYNYGKSKPQRKFYYSITDSVSPFFWSFSGGYFIIQAGFFHLLDDVDQLEAILVLEMAHEDILNTTSFDQNSYFQSENKDFWLSYIKYDPNFFNKKSYTRTQEVLALIRVYKYYNFNPELFQKVISKLSNFLKKIENMQYAKGYFYLHKNWFGAINEVKLLIANNKIELNTDAKQRPYSPLNYNVLKIQNEIFHNPSQQYYWIYFDEQKYNFSNSNKFKYYSKISQSFEREEYSKALRLVNEALIKFPYEEPFLILKIDLLECLFRFDESLNILKSKWINFESRRILKKIEVLLVSGQISHAQDEANRFIKLYPNNILGAFWVSFINLKLNNLEKANSDLVQYQNYWGERPIIRALKAVLLWKQGRSSDAIQVLNFQSKQYFTSEEWGIFFFVKYWIRKQGNLVKNDSITEEYFNYAKKYWPTTLHLRHY